MRLSSNVIEVFLALIMLSIVACTTAPEPRQGGDTSIIKTAPEPTPPPSCGSEVIQLGQGYDAKARDCIWQAYQKKQPALFSTTRYTIEGDPIQYAIKVTDAAIVVIIDSKDRFGPKGVSEHTCQTMDKVVQESARDRYSFVLGACSGASTDQITVP